MQLKSFTHTSPGLQILVFIGWGLANISLSFVFYPFINKAYTASLVGYIVALWFTIISVTLNLSMFEFPKTMPSYLNIIPYFAFSRLYYHISRGCANDQ